MAVLECGINIGNRNLIEVRYYASSDVLDPNLRAGFLSALESFTTEVFSDSINVVSLASFKLVCFCEMVALPGEDKDNTQPLLAYAIIEKETESEVVKRLLNKIIMTFQNRYSVLDIFEKKPKYFKKFDIRISDILGDLKMKTEDRFKSLF
ncbi:MAG: hypothetical protein EU529_03190 [Promethearchaeota archaeon]|nr:MAG: hypothetical protein EU529_03190 [Candidatus Lokiarchaeota archaeon]